MTKNEMLILPLGARVIYSVKLRRRDRSGDGLRHWLPEPVAAPLTGVYVGYRWLPEGTSEYYGEDGYCWKTNGKGILAALIAHHPRKKPVYVDPRFLEVA